jgi:hypothetical protein
MAVDSRILIRPAGSLTHAPSIHPGKPGPFTKSDLHPYTHSDIHTDSHPDPDQHSHHHTQAYENENTYAGEQKLHLTRRCVCK